jgi:hypothetical protein
MIDLLIGLLVACLVVGLVWYCIGMIPMPQPVRTIVTIIFAIICILVLLQYVSLGGLGFHSRC